MKQSFLFSAALVFVQAAACSDSAGPDPEIESTNTVAGDPAMPTVESPAFPLRNLIAQTSDRYDPRGDVFLIGTDGSTRRRLTDASSADACPAVSPTGNGIAFLAGNNVVIWSASGRVSVAGLTCPVWSPDGTRVVTSAGSLLTIHSLAGAAIAQLRSGRLVADYAWAPDANSLAYTTCLEVKGPCLDHRINVVQTTNFSETEARFVAAGAAPSYSPDGATIAFKCGNLGQICTVASAGGAATQLALGSRPLWSPVNQEIAYGCGEFLCIINAVTRASRQLPAKATQHRWSPDGLALALVWGGFNTDVHAINSDGTNSRNVTRDRSRDGLGSWSPVAAGASTAVIPAPAKRWTGEKRLADDDMVFQNTKSETSQDAIEPLRIIDSRGERSRTLFRSALGESCPSVSLDRKSVAFESLGIWVAAADGTGEVQVSDTQRLMLDSCPVLSPDGRYVAFVSGTGGDMKLWIASIADETTKLVAGGSDIREIAWSPDSRAVVFRVFSVGSANATLMRGSVDGSASTFGQSSWSHPSFTSDGRVVVQCGSQICIAGAMGENSRALAEGSTPLVSPDSKKIVFRRATQLLVMNLEGGELRNILSLGFVPSWTSWSPASDAIAFEANKNVNVVRIDGSFAKQITSAVWAVRPSWTSQRIVF